MLDVEKIYSLYFSQVYYFIFGISKNEEIAKDIAGETFFKLIEKADDFRNEASIKTYLFTIAKNLYFTHLRKNKKKLNLENIEEFSLDEDIEEKVIRNQEYLRIIKEIETFDEPVKGVLIMRLFYDLSFKSIGEFYGKTDNWACVSFYRARKKLAERIKKYE